jgi:predicted MFS family arabinose efflux permease
MIRTRWAMLYSGTQHLHTAYSLEAALDEVIFMTGPVMIAVTADVNRNVPLLVVSGLSIGGLGWLAAQRRTQPPVDQAGRRNAARSVKRVWPPPGIAVLFVCAVGIGGMLGAADLAILATGSGHLTEAGLIIALWAASSAIGGVISGAFQRGVRVLGRIRMGTTVLWLCMLPLIAFSGLGPVAVILFFAGFALAPTVSAMNVLAETRMTDQTLTEGLSWITSGITLGATAGTVAAGWAADRASPHAAFATASVFSAIAMICAWSATTSDGVGEVAGPAPDSGLTGAHIDPSGAGT